MSLGQRDAPDVAARQRRLPAAVAVFVGAVIAAGAWAGLVVVAVRWGRDAHDVGAWALTVAAVTAGVACMLLLFALLSRSWALLNGTAPARRAPGRRRR
jgi:hypothetical protein